jgi:hypothetical protein
LLTAPCFSPAASRKEVSSALALSSLAILVTIFFILLPKKSVNFFVLKISFAPSDITSGRSLYVFLNSSIEGFMFSLNNFKLAIEYV